MLLFLAYHKVKIKEIENIDNYLDITRELKKVLNHDSIYANNYCSA